MIDRVHLRVAILKALIVLAPSYLAAYLTDKMVYVVPTLAAASFLAATLKFDENSTIRHVDEDGDGEDQDDVNGIDIIES